MNKTFGDYSVEVWEYNPKLLCENNYVDRLSLYLVFKNEQDERIQASLRELLNEVKWL